MLLQCQLMPTRCDMMSLGDAIPIYLTHSLQAGYAIRITSAFRNSFGFGFGGAPLLIFTAFPVVAAEWIV